MSFCRVLLIVITTLSVSQGVFAEGDIGEVLGVNSGNDVFKLGQGAASQEIDAVPGDSSVFQTSSLRGETVTNTVSNKAIQDNSSLPLESTEGGQAALVEETENPSEIVGDNVARNITQEVTLPESEIEGPGTTPNGPALAPTAKVTGDWHIQLTDGTLRQLSLTLNQLGEIVFGSGEITSNNATKETTASGSVSGPGFNLEVVSVDGKELYSLEVSKNNETLSGSYEGFFVTGETWSGSISGTSED